VTARAARGLTGIGAVLWIALAGFIYWCVSFGPAYWENLEVDRVMREAANLCYHEQNDENVRQFVFGKLHGLFDEKIEDHGRIVTQMRIDAAPQDLQIQRTQIPPKVELWITYSRPVTLALVGKTRTVTFTDHAEADLSPIKW
jgi:hypothetical protein